MDILNTVFMNVLLVTFTSSIIAVIILLIRYLFKAKISIRFNQILLSFILLRFCMLIVPESSMSILNLLPQYGAENTISESLSTIHPNIENRQTPRNSIGKITQVDYIKNNDKRLELPTVSTTHVENKISFTNILSIIWLAGLLIILIGAILIQGRFTYKLKSCERIDDSELLIIMEKCKKILGIKRNVNIYMGDNFKSPFIIGIFRPSVYIPKQMIKVDKEHFQHVILHELAHYKRKDLIYNIFSVIAIGIHWFNPIIWKITSIIRSDIELACDTYVLDRLGEDNAISYGESILVVTRLFLSRRNQIGLACYLNNTKKQLERRIIMINKFKKNTYKFTALSIMSALLIGGIVLTNPVSARQKNDELKDSIDNLEIDENKDMMDDILVKLYCNRYNNLDSFIDNVEFDFMVPDYVPQNNYYLGELAWFPHDERARLFYDNDNGFFVDIMMFQKDPDEYFGNRTVKIDRYPSSIEGIEGEILVTKFGSETTKHFIYKKNDIYYVIDYQKVNGDNSIKGEIPLSEVAEIIKSLKNPEDVDKSIFDLPNIDFCVYSMEDMETAREIVGFDFKLPIDDFLGKYTRIQASEDRKDINLNFEGGFNLVQTQEIPYYYNQFTKLGKLEIADSEKVWFEKMEGNWEYINNRKVLKIIYTCELFGNQTEPDRDIEYVWCDNDIYYCISYNGYTSPIDIEKAMKHIMDSNSFDEIIKENSMN
ncbi:M56 family metallopeptidase [Vallitalea guaymasensis]|uniref:M56 family metallopeptidase n=1 Tax=Vallitalea guaymasensis TaxID=1185412 RepID=A0A8J8M849_9FIRM|nr:M56 family metallopeptidase [Vallitalea guaymasensis]QUH27950.1 M56 family metallopeptidase [Vallitalea guaymasensis]